MNNSEKLIRNNHNMIIGVCKEFADRIVATHYRKGFVGTYVKGTDVTVDKDGKIYCYGDGSADLIRKAEQEMR